MKKEETNEETTEETTDSTIEESAEADVISEESQLNPKHRTAALSSLIAGYVLALGFGILLVMGTEESEPIANEDEAIEEGEMVSAVDAAAGE